LNTDSTFFLSRKAVWRLCEEARQLGCSACYLFRGRAYALAHAENPKFDLGGQPLTCAFGVGINDDVHAALISVADQLDVPRETIGELVACYIQEGAYVEA
jgi:hypothetical protein